MKITKKAKAEIRAYAKGKSLYAMNAPYRKGYAFNLDKDGNLYSGMFIDEHDDVREWDGFCMEENLIIKFNN